MTGSGKPIPSHAGTKHLGYPKIKVLHGGFAAWTAAGLPVSAEVPTPIAAEFPVDMAAGGVIIDAPAMLAAVSDPEIAKLDVRDVDE